MFTTYILYSANLDRYYVGYTGTSLHSRLQKHLANHTGFTGREADGSLFSQNNLTQNNWLCNVKNKSKVGKAGNLLKNSFNQKRVEKANPYQVSGPDDPAKSVMSGCRPMRRHLNPDEVTRASVLLAFFYVYHLYFIFC